MPSNNPNVMKNIKPIRDSERARQMQRLGVAKQVESRKRNTTVKKLLKEWANRNVSQDDLERLKEAGVIDAKDFTATNRAIVSLQIIKKSQEGDLKALAMLLAFIGDNERYELEIKKLKEENKKLKLEQEKLKFETGVNKDIENLDTLADMLAVKDEMDVNEN